MLGLSFELARIEHTKEIQRMRRESGVELAKSLGPGRWTGPTQLSAIRERIAERDPEKLRYSTIYVACQKGEPVGSVIVTTFPPGFWKPKHWKEPEAPGLGVFNLVVFPALQRKGLGTFIMHGVEQLARDRAIPFVRLDAYRENLVSTAFYKRIGYSERAQVEVRALKLVLFEKKVC